MTIANEAIDALHQRIKDLAANSTHDQLAYLAKSLESMIGKKAISDIVQMAKIKEIIDALQKRLKDLYQFSLLVNQISGIAEFFNCRVRKRGNKFA